jgi:hypothetical protein
MAFGLVSPSNVAANAKTLRAEENPTEESDEPPVDEMERGPSLAGNYISFGPALSAGLFPATDESPRPMGYSFSGGHAWDVRGAMITLGGDFLIQSNALFFDAGLGTRFFLSEKDISPFLGGFFGLGLAKSQAESLITGTTAGGFAAGIDGGFQFFRTSDIHLEVGITWRILLNEVVPSAGLPWMGGLRLGLFF